MAFKIFIDGEAGTTGLKVAERLQVHPHVQLLRIDNKFRKDKAARADVMGASDITILCLPDDAAIEAAALAETVETKLIDASSGLFNVALGHGRKRIADAVYTQMMENDYTSPFQTCHPSAFSFASRLSHILPDGFEHVFLLCMCVCVRLIRNQKSDELCRF